MSQGMYGTSSGGGTGAAIFTDDVSLQVFMEHLKRLVSLAVSAEMAYLNINPRLLEHRLLEHIDYAQLVQSSPAKNVIHGQTWSVLSG